MGQIIAGNQSDETVREVNQMTCATCAAWEPQEGKPTGKCRFKAPLAHVIPLPVQTMQGNGIQLNVITAWPETSPTDFCFDHLEHETETVENSGEVIIN